MIAEFVSRKMMLMGVAAWMSVAVPVATSALPGNEMWAQKPDADVHAKGDISGDWQGTLTPPQGKALRIIARIAKGDKGGWTAKFYSIDQGAQSFAANTVTLDGATVKFTIDMIGGGYTGALNSDQNAMAGTWSQGSAPIPLTLVRATKETAWEIPAPRPPPKPMPADANPSFDVATIKPNDSGEASMQQLSFDGHNFRTRNSSVLDLISFAFDVQKKQIVNAPDWIDKDRYDVVAVPDMEGFPSMMQAKGMVRKLLADRFKMTFHHDKRDLSAFVLTVAKTGPKLTANETKSPGPGFGLRPLPSGVNIPIQNADMGEFASFLQAMVLDRPVVDQTGLEGKFDFVLKFSPDDSMFNGHPPTLPTKTESTESLPSLFEAMPKDLGLKLDAQKTAVDVIAIDRIEKPSAN
jgi:uncharacterized protein (TIGR03435 family)